MGFTIREILPEVHLRLGRLMVEAYTALEGFPKPDEQPDYYEVLAKYWQKNEASNTRVLVAVGESDEILGGEVYFSDMACDGPDGSATLDKKASTIRLLAVSPAASGAGVSKGLSMGSIDGAKTHI